MSSYKLIQGRNGIRYMKDGKLVAKASLPPEIFTQLEVDKIVTDEELTPVVDKTCIFCGMGSHLYRLVHNQTVYICDVHYYSESIGKIAQRMREREEEKQSEKVPQLQS